MSLLADENIDHPIVLALRELGFDVLSISELHPAVPDEQVLELALTQERLLITSDKDLAS